MDEKIRHHLGLWLVLLVLLGLNVAGSFVNLGSFNPALTLAIAGIQAFLIVSFFMYMRAAAPVPRIVAATGFVWLLIMMGLTLSDYRTRPEDIALGRMLPEPAWESPPQGAVPTPLSAGRDYRPEPPAPRPAKPAMAQAAAAAGSSPASGEQVFQKVCSACHGQGLLGAPKVGDKAAWQPHAAHGMEMLVSHALNGYGAMPPKGGHPELSEQDIRNAIGYMLGASGITLPSGASENR
jgi:cytochrome c oxidase subunit 4